MAGSPVAPDEWGVAGPSCEEMCVRGWDHYVRISLRGLVETGQGAAGSRSS